MGYLHIKNCTTDHPIFLFKECFALEKLHGCLKKDAKIFMGDGTYKRLKDVKVGDEVMGVINNRGVPVKVTAKYNNGTTKDWFRVITTRNRAGRGPAKASLMCTKEHRFLNPKSGEYIKAENLKVGDSVLLLRNTSELEATPLQEQVLLGKMLGDAYLYQSTNVASVCWGHCEKDEEYLEWSARAVGNLDYGVRDKRTSGYGTQMIRTRTTGTAWIKEKFGSFIQDGRKTVPSWVANELTPIAMAFWYMDDGSLGHGTDGSEDKANFAVCAFTEKECSVLQSGLMKYGIKSEFFKSDPKKYSRLTLRALDAEKFFLLVAPYIPPCMQRKLPARYRGHSGWIPSIEQTFRPHLVEQTVLETFPVELKTPTTKMDLETESHNYIANSIVVHNSSTHLSFNPDQPESQQLTVFSGGIKYDDFVKCLDLEAILAKFKESGTKCTVFGEGYGGKCQKMKNTYGPDIKFCAFDVRVDYNGVKRWLDVPRAELFVKNLGLEFVHYKKVPATIEALDAERDAPSEQAIRNGCGNDKIREGIVCRPLLEFSYDGSEESRIICKHKRAEFRETKSVRTLQSEEKQAALNDAIAIVDEYVVPMRLEHVLQKLGDPDLLTIERTKDVIGAMVEDVLREGEIKESKILLKEIGNRTVKLYKHWLNKNLHNKEIHEKEDD